eukprot:TRINITY_DN2036_c0_g1_i1.p1 TRINITY_DN2036_c0_g1~~TRINITY_DN2036_c0_g1_i1.p1  ORF type:complete len:1616 (+),score=340.19 TRINITY_DN2036_c0_g1_i1:94-4941(+)
MDSSSILTPPRAAPAQRSASPSTSTRPRSPLRSTLASQSLAYPPPPVGTPASSSTTTIEQHTIRSYGGGFGDPFPAAPAGGVKVDMGNLNVVINALVTSVKELTARCDDNELHQQELQKALRHSSARVQELEALRGDLEHRVAATDLIVKRELQHLQDRQEVGAAQVSNRDVKYRLELADLNTRMDRLLGEQQALAHHMSAFQAQVDRRVEDGLATSARLPSSAGMDAVVRQLVHDALQDQRQQIITEMRTETSLLRNYSSPQNSSAEFQDLAARVDAMQSVLTDASELKRHLSDVDGSLDALSRRLETLYVEVAQRPPSGVSNALSRARPDALESLIHEHRATLTRAVEDVRLEILSKASDAEMQRAASKLDVFSGDLKTMRTALAKLEQQVQDTKQVYGMINDLNERITNTFGDFETTGVALSGELGEVKGRTENLNARQQALELKVADIGRAVQHQLEETATNIGTRLESLVTATAVQLEGRVSQRLDTVVSDSRQSRAETRQGLQQLEAKWDELDQIVGRVTHQLDTTVTERVNQNHLDIRELARRVDLSLSDRKENSQAMRSELSEVQTVINGLQQQYEALLTDAAKRNGVWADMSRDLRARVEFTESGMQAIRQTVESTLDSIRQQAAVTSSSQLEKLTNQVDSLETESQKHQQIVQRVEEDTKILTRTLAEFDDAVTREVGSLRDAVGNCQLDSTQLFSRVDALEARVDSDSGRMAKALLEIDEQFNTALSGARGQQDERSDQILQLRAQVEALAGKNPHVESKFQESARLIQALQSEVSTLRDGLEGAVRPFQIEELQGEIRAVSAAARDMRTHQDRQDAILKGLGGSLDEARGEAQEAHSQVARLREHLGGSEDEHRTSKAAIQRLESQVTALTKTCKELLETEAKGAESVSQLQAAQQDLAANLTGAAARSDAVKRLETTVAQNQRTLQHLGEDQARLAQAVSELHASQAEITAGVAGASIRLEPTVKRLEGQLNALQKSIKDLGGADDRLQQSLTDIEIRHAQVDGTLSALQQRVEGLSGKPLATEAALKDIRQQIETNNAQLRTDVTSLVEDVRTQNSTLSTDVQQKLSNIGGVLREHRTRIEVLESTSKDFTTAQHAALEQLQRSSDERAEVGMKRVEAALGDIRTIREKTQKLESQVTDIASGAKQLGQTTDSVATRLQQLESTMGTDLQQLKGRGDRQDRAQQAFENRISEAIDRLNQQLESTSTTVRQNLEKAVVTLQQEVQALRGGQQDLGTKLQAAVQQSERQLGELVDGELAGNTKRVEEQFKKFDDKLFQEVEGLQGKQEKLVALIKQLQGQLEGLAGGRVEELAAKLDLVVQKQELLDKFDKFGMKMITELRQQIEQAEGDQKKLADEHTHEVDRIVTARLADFDGKLQLILEREQTLASTKEFGAKVVQDLQRQMSDIRHRVESDLHGFAQVFDLESSEITAAADSGVEQRVALLLRKPLFAAILRRIGDRPGAGFGPSPSGEYPSGGTRSASSSISSTTSSATGDAKPAVGLDISEHDGQGVRVGQVKPGGPAYEAGLVAGDVVVALNDTPVTNRHDYKRVIKQYKPGDIVVHTVRRASSGATANLPLRLGSAAPGRSHSIGRKRDDSLSYP